MLIIDDEQRVALLLSTALRNAGYRVHAVSSAAEAMLVLRESKFDIVFADVNLPDSSILHLLERIKAAVPELPVVMITGPADVETARAAMKLGACDCVSKPFTVNSVAIIVQRIVTRQVMAQSSEESHHRELQNSYETVLDALLTALDTRDTETEGHSERVTGYTMVLAQKLGMPLEDQYDVERGALLHDIGKIGVPDRILLKPGPLTEAEWTEMRRHPAIGHRMCARIDFLKGASEIILHHHERWDGAGYPVGLKHEEIPLGARIFAVVDAFDAITTDRTYRAAMSYDDAVAEIRKHSGLQFDPRVADAFLQVPEERWLQMREMIGQK